MKTLLLFPLSVLLVFLTACGGDDSEALPADTANEAPASDGESAVEAGGSMRDAAGQWVAEVAAEREALVAEMRAALESATTGESLRDTASQALGNFARGEGDQSRQLLENVNEAREEVQERLEAVRDAKPQNWDEVKMRAREALDRFNEALAKLRGS